MKEYKQKIVDALVDRAKTDRIVSLKETARETGTSRLSSEEAREILTKASKLTGYRIVKFVNKGYESLFECGALVDKDIEFENA